MSYISLYLIFIIGFLIAISVINYACVKSRFSVKSIVFIVMTLSFAVVCIYLSMDGIHKVKSEYKRITNITTIYTLNEELEGVFVLGLTEDKKIMYKSSSKYNTVSYVDAEDAEFRKLTNMESDAFIIPSDGKYTFVVPENTIIQLEISQ